MALSRRDLKSGWFSTLTLFKFRGNLATSPSSLNRSEVASFRLASNSCELRRLVHLAGMFAVPSACPLLYSWGLRKFFSLGVKSRHTSKAATRNMSSDFFSFFHLAFLIVLWKLSLP